MIRYIVAMMTLIASFAIVVPAKANFFTDFVDAVTGHVDDINDRLNHDDEFVSGTTIASAEFRKDDVGRDTIHWANGTASIVKDGSRFYVQLDEDFTSGPAPDLYIYTADRKVVDEGSFWKAERTEVGKLKSGSGAQFYELESFDGSTEIVIWCKRFGAFIAAVTLTDGS